MTKEYAKKLNELRGRIINLRTKLSEIDRQRHTLMREIDKVEGELRHLITVPWSAGVGEGQTIRNRTGGM